MASKFDKARKAISAMGYTLTRRPDGEFRYNVKSGSEETAGYTNDLDDAVSTVRYEVTNGKIEAAAKWHREVRNAERDADTYVYRADMPDWQADIVIPTGRQFV